MKEIDETKIIRLEIINHASVPNGLSSGRILKLYKLLGDFKSIELSIQDNEQTLKIFLK